MLFRARLSSAATLSLSLLLAACGGGGGGDSDNSLRIGPLSPAEVSAKWADSGQGLRPQVTLSAGYTGTPSGTVYVVVEDPDKLFTSAVPIVGTAQASLELSPAFGDLAPGRYTKPLVVHVCKDANCTSEYGGSPQTVRKDILVESLTVTPAKLNFTALVAMGAAAQSITITPPAGKDYGYDAYGYVTYKTPDGNISSTSRRLDEVFEVTKTGTGLQVKPKAAWAGQYIWTSFIDTPGYVRRSIEVVYDVSGQGGEAFTVLTPQVSATAVGDEVVYADVDVKVNIPPSEVRISVAGTPDPVEHGWVRFYDSLPIEGGTRYRFRINSCGYGVRSCLGVGSHSATLTVAASAYGANWTYNVPLSFTVR